MKIPCAYKPAFIIAGFAFLKPEPTNIQLQNLTMIATALILGAKFNLAEISLMWLQEKSVGTLSEFLSDAKFSMIEMERLHLLNMRKAYKIKGGYFLIDDAMKHRTKFCKWIHGARSCCSITPWERTSEPLASFFCITAGGQAKFPICHRIFYQEKSLMPWRRGKKIVYKTKNELALEMLQWALDNVFPKCTVLADAWFGVGPFIKGLRRMKLNFVVEINPNLNARVASKEPKLTPKGNLCKNQYDLVNIKKHFEAVLESRYRGFAADKEKGKKRGFSTIRRSPTSGSI